VPKTRAFIGSSSAARSQAKALIKKFENPTLEFLPWWDAFVAGKTLLENLDAVRTKVDAAILVMSPESETTIRGKVVQVPNLNVLFEFRFFYGHLGNTRVAALKYGDFYLPSDLGGYTHIFGSTYFKRGAVVQVGKRTESEFARWLALV
jgi:predicted nucleotide-binding protein